jgi:D-beta-D-heptose 7-phosphate kinase/D-beta-D-heptose 1-phosphate adenosyltransferase
MSATPAELSAFLDAAAGRPILVVGDVMLDHFVVGRVDRISPEAPVPVVCFEQENYRLGGAGNVAHNVAALGGNVELLGIVGDDEPAAQLRAGLTRAGVRHDALVTDPSRCTTRKLRVVTTRNQQVARIDYESDREAAGQLQDGLAAAVRSRAAGAAVVVLSDYQKGAITREVAQAAIAAARSAGVPILIDPKVPHVDYYSGASLVTPNHHEAEAVTLMRIRSAEEARQAAIRFRERVGCESVLITRGEHGMWLLAPDAEFDLRAEAREVSDVTGAGDTVIAAMAIGLAGGGSLEQAARLANHAAGLAVSHFGPTAVSADELRNALLTA